MEAKDSGKCREQDKESTENNTGKDLVKRQDALDKPSTRDSRTVAYPDRKKWGRVLNQILDTNNKSKERPDSPEKDYDFSSMDTNFSSVSEDETDELEEMMQKIRFKCFSQHSLTSSSAHTRATSTGSIKTKAINGELAQFGLADVKVNDLDIDRVKSFNFSFT